MALEGESERAWLGMKPCFIIAETSLDLSTSSAAIENARERERETGAETFLEREKDGEESVGPIQTRIDRAE